MEYAAPEPSKVHCLGNQLRWNHNDTLRDECAWVVLVAAVVAVIAAFHSYQYPKRPEYPYQVSGCDETGMGGIDNNRARSDSLSL